MPAILVSYDLNSPGQKYSAVYDAIDALGAWARPLESTWIVVGPGLTAQHVYDRVRPALDDNDHIFAVDISAQDRQGWLSKDIWDWIRRNV